MFLEVFKQSTTIKGNKFALTGTPLCSMTYQYLLTILIMHPVCNMVGKSQLLETQWNHKY